MQIDPFMFECLRFWRVWVFFAPFLFSLGFSVKGRKFEFVVGRMLGPRVGPYYLFLGFRLPYKPH